jgi:hypothetical protein
VEKELMVSDLKVGDVLINDACALFQPGQKAKVIAHNGWQVTLNIHSPHSGKPVILGDNGTRFWNKRR